MRAVAVGHLRLRHLVCKRTSLRLKLGTEAVAVATKLLKQQNYRVLLNITKALEAEKYLPTVSIFDACYG